MINQRSKIATMIMFVIALGFLVYGGFKYFSEKAKYDDLVKSCSEQADAEVLSSDPYTVTRRKRVSKYNKKKITETYYLTTVKYTVDGKDYTCKHDSKTSFPVGAMTTVKYDPSDPGRSFVGSMPMNSYQTHLKTMIVGGVLALAGVVTLFKNRGH